MSSTSSPFGLRPAYSPSGIIRPAAMTILTGYATTILQNQPVKIAADGTVAAAAVGDRFVGVFQGVEYTDANGRRTVSNKWTASTAGTEIVAYITIDPTIVYEIQTDATVAIATIGLQYDFTTIGTGSTTTGLSAMMLGVSTSATNASLQLLNIAPYQDNAWGDTYVIVQVRISEHQLVADVAAF
jgi:hypothetical protein